MKKGIVISAILVLFLAGIAFSYGGWRGGSSRGWKGGYGGGWGTGFYPIVSLSLKYKTEIGLNQDQILALEKIQTDFGEEAKAQYEKIRTFREGLKTDLEGNNFTGVEQKIREMGNIHTDLLIKRLKAFRKAKTEILTAEQYGKLKEIIESKRGS